MSGRRSLVELKVRLQAANKCVRVLKQADLAKDPRTPSAIAHYQGQAQKLADEIKENYGAKNIPPTVVGLKTAKLFSKGDIN